MVCATDNNMNTNINTHMDNSNLSNYNYVLKNLDINQPASYVNNHINSLDSSILSSNNHISNKNATNSFLMMKNHIKGLSSSLTNDAKWGSLTELQSLIKKTPAGGTLKLYKNYRYQAGDSKKGVIINKALNIKGNNKIIDGHGVAKAFNIITTRTVTFDKISIINCQSNSNGAAISANNLNLYGCTLENNYAYEHNGGAIYATGHIKMSNCNFTGNLADCTGGAIYAKTITLFNHNSFEYNLAEMGGAMDVMRINILSHNNFKNNMAQIGGVIHSGDYINIGDFNNVENNEGYAFGGAFSAITVKIGSSNNFNNNTGYEFGGVVCTEDNLIIGNGNKFTNNKGYSIGGVIDSQGNITIGDSNLFDNNLAKGWGGAIANLVGNTYLKLGNHNIFSNNSALVDSMYKGSGGAIYSLGSISMEGDNYFINNSATSYGAAISVPNDSTSVNPYLDISKATFVGNYLTDSSLQQGGAIYFTGVNCNIKESIFNENSAITGSDIYLGNNSKFNLDNNYWSMNYTNENSFIKSGLVTYESKNVTPNNWILLDIKSASDMMVGKSSNFTIGFDKICNKDGSIEDYDGSNFKDYNVSVNGNDVHIIDGKGAFTYTPEANKFTLIAKNSFGKEVARNDFKVNILNTVITANDLEIPAFTSKNLTITLKDSDGKVLAGKDVTFNFNGKNYTRTTNSKGVASLAIKSTDVKTYKATINFAGDKEYIGSNKTVNVVVKPSYVNTKQIIQSSVKLKKYINKYKKLPNKINVGNIKCTIPQYSYLAAAGIKNVNANKLSSKVKVINVNATNQKTKVKVKVSKKSYLNTVNKLSDAGVKGKLPSYINAKGKKVGFEVYTYGLSKVLNFYNSNNYLPYTLNFTSEY